MKGQSNPQIGRLAFREEGKWWVAYYAPNTSDMKDAEELARCSMTLAKSEDRRKEFITFVRNIFADLVEEAIGVRPVWGEPVVAPDHERAGHA